VESTKCSDDVKNKEILRTLAADLIFQHCRHGINVGDVDTISQLAFMKKYRRMSRKLCYEKEIIK
jgi:hypothetical protein